MLDSYVYNLDLRWTGGRSGQLTSAGPPHLDFSAPPEFHGEPDKWSPEQLLLAAAASCFTTTFIAIAELHKLSVRGFRMHAFARLEKVPGEGYRFTEVTLVPEIEADHNDVETVLKVIAKAEKNCFVAKSLRATMQVEPKFVPIFEEAVV
jgi:peroxiredoxin-like protein